MATEAANALYPPARISAGELPTFVSTQHTLLVGERAGFVFFEPRYIRMCRLALGIEGATTTTPEGKKKSKKRKPSGRFIHLPARTEQLPTGVPALGTLCTIVDLQEQRDGTYKVECIAGPRVQVLKQRDEDMEGEEEAAPLLHVEYQLRPDDPPTSKDDAQAQQKLVEQCLSALEDSPFSPRVAALGTPPPLNPESLGFFLCRLLLHETDIRQRLCWLYGSSTTERLTFALEMLEAKPHTPNAPENVPGGEKIKLDQAVV
jgi:Lon protease-like protein